MTPDAPPSARRNVLWSAAERGLLTLLSIVTSPLIVHGFGETRFGILSIGLTTLGFLAFLDLGITAAAVREIAQARAVGDTNRVRRVFASALGLYLLLGLVAGSALAAAAPWLVDDLFHIGAADRDDALFVMRMGGLGLGLNLMLAPMTAVPRALQRLDLSTGLTMAVSVVTTAGTVLAARADSLHAAVVVQIGSTVAGMAAYFAVTRRLAPEIRFWPALDPKSLQALWNFAIFQLLAQVFGTLSVYADRLILAAWLTPADVTWYGVPAGLSQKIHVIAAAAAAFVFPRMAELHARDDGPGMARLYAQGVRLTMLLAVLLAAPVLAGGHAFLVGWMGPAFAAQAAPSLLWTVAAYACYCATVMPVLTLLGLGRPREVAWISFMTGGANVVLALLLVPRLGRDGAGVAMLGSMALAFLPLLSVRRLVGVATADLVVPLLRLAPVGAAAAGATWLAGRVLPAHVLTAVLALGVGAVAGLVAWRLLPGCPAADADLLLRRTRR